LEKRFQMACFRIIGMEAHRHQPVHAMDRVRVGLGVDLEHLVIIRLLLDALALKATASLLAELEGNMKLIAERRTVPHHGCPPGEVVELEEDPLSNGNLLTAQDPHPFA
jgi:hypothetical protein